MRRVVQILGLLALAFVLFVVGVAVLGPQPTADGGSLALTYTGPDQRSGDYAGFAVRFRNTTDAPVENPQLRAVVDFDGQEWACQGYADPVSGLAVTGADPITRPLVIPAGEDMPVTIYCQMPQVRTHTADVRLR